MNALRRHLPAQRLVSRRGARAYPRVARAFTLLEVMVAVAVLALGLSVLFQVQARSILIAQQARALTVATQLARGKLYDCEAEMLKRGFSEGDFKEEGRFDEEGYDDFFWECHGYKPDLPMPDASDITEAASSGALGGGSADDPNAGPLGALGGLAGGLAGGQGGDDMAAMGVGMIAPVLGQISQVVGESIRELVVIVRWKEGETWEELRVATHLTDTTAINAMAQGIGQMSGQMSNLTNMLNPGAGGGNNAGANPTGGNRGAPGANIVPPSPAGLPGGRGLPRGR